MTEVTNTSAEAWVESLKYDQNGLITAVIQDAQNNEVLMVAYMNREAVKKTIEGPLVNFYSRSRQKMWVKGETSGHTQTVKAILFDCDKDCLLIKVEQKMAACHEGYRTCFFREYKNEQVQIKGQPIFNKDHVYKS